MARSLANRRSAGALIEPNHSFHNSSRRYYVLVAGIIAPILAFANAYGAGVSLSAQEQLAWSGAALVRCRRAGQQRHNLAGCLGC